LDSSKDVTRDCNTCTHHVQGAVSIDEAPAHCWDCSRSKSLPSWEPIELRVEKLTPTQYATLHGTDSALNVQISGDHYKSLKIQPIEYIHANNIPYMEGNVIKYVTRWRDKNGLKDLEKAKHYIDLIIEMEGLK
jgi:hypothetical protein